MGMNRLVCRHGRVDRLTVLLQYQIETEEIDEFREELRIWKNCGSLENRPPPMIIEVYLDASTLKESQSLVILDEDGKRWDVMEQLAASTSSSGSDSLTTVRRPTEVILERWRVELKTITDKPLDDFGPILPTIYKKAIVFFRSLFVATKLLPAWKFASQGAVKNSHPALIPRCRIRMSDPDRSRPDLLKNPIDGRRDAVTEYMFGDLEVPVGRLCTTVIYRNDCTFRVDDAESLLSSRFMGVDENFFKPSLPQRHMAEVGSLRDHRRGVSVNEVHQTYGSLSTFHGDGPMGTSPISALRAVKPPGSDTSSPPASLPRQTDAAAAAPHSLPISGRASAARPTVRVGEERRRPSISFQPFKAGSLSGSPVPRQSDPESPASLTRPSLPSLRQPGNRSSLTAGMPASLRGGPVAVNTTETPIAGSPRPASASRYSSSFTHRRGRLSIGSTSRAGDEEQGSSGRQSLASSIAQPGSGFLAEVGAASYSSLQTEEDDISDFLKALDSKKTLKSFEPTKKGESATSRTVAQLSKFHMMRESNNALTESMTSSMQLNRSSTVSSRQLANLTGIGGTISVSTSSSPGKPVSPHTPHTPAIPSRLSENSIIDYAPSYKRVEPPEREVPPSRTTGAQRQGTTTQDGTTAIDIPLSPRLGTYHRRSSSVAQQVRAATDDEEADLPFATHRSISLGADDREPPTLSTLLGRQMQLDDECSGQQGDASGALRPAAGIQTAESSDVLQRGSASDTPPDGFIAAAQPSSPFQRRRYAGMAGGRRSTPPHSSRGSFAGSTSRLGRPDDEAVGEEPLVFTLSEMDALGRRSLEEGRGGGASADRSSFEPRGTSRRGWPSD
ncbi:autophagy atg13 [Trichoderma arundinaceum]|uniref:Autophagy-related protein 13 n=1 Tax=Trichoderma arundinaceum TaxID=490622 RepID=A0A395NCD4_TRIAR|nr:autophagy atg13 [Trichoderma arundinaceum]